MTKIETHIDRAHESTISSIALIAHSMKAKFTKYWEKMEPFASIAIVLDPRYKLEFHRFHLSVDLDWSKSNVDHQISKVRDNLYKYYSNYAPDPKPANPQDTTSIQSATSFLDDDDEDSKFKRYLAGSKRSTNNGSPTAELDLYLQEPNVEVPHPAKLNILDWWKANYVRFPHLSQLVQTILMAPMTSVASESAFSTSGRILDDFRSRLSPATLEALICAQDWLRSDIQ
jgi:hypothetical protein